GTGRNRGGSASEGEGGGTTHSQSHTRTQHLRDVMEDYQELVKREFFDFQQWQQVWAAKVRKLKTGQCVLRAVDEDALRHVMVRRSVPGHLEWTPEEVRRFLPRAEEKVLKMLEKNYASDFFASPAEIDREREKRLQEVIRPRIELRSGGNEVVPDAV